MKGRWPEAELAALPAGWRVTASRQLHIPGLDAARCVIALARSARGAPRVTDAPSAYASSSGRAVVSLMTASAIEEFTDCTPGKRDRWSRKKAS